MTVGMTWCVLIVRMYIVCDIGVCTWRRWGVRVGVTGMYIVCDTEDVHDGVYLCEEACVTVMCVTVRISMYMLCV